MKRDLDRYLGEILPGVNILKILKGSFVPLRYSLSDLTHFSKCRKIFKVCLTILGHYEKSLSY